MNQCCDNAERLAAYLDRTLSDEERRSCEEHLAECPRCRAELVAIDEELRALGLDRPAREALSARTASAAAGERIPAVVRFTSWLGGLAPVRGRAFAVSVSLAVILAVAAILLLPRYVPSLDPDLRQGAAGVERILASSDIGDLRLVGEAMPAGKGGPSLRGLESTERALFDRTEESLEKALLRHPSDARAYRLLGDLYIAGGEAQRAGTFYERSLLVRPDDPVLLNNLAVAQFRAGDIESSRATLERAFGLVDAPPEICYNLAVIWRESGNREEMRRYLRLYLAKDPASPWAVRAQRMLSE